MDEATTPAERLPADLLHQYRESLYRFHFRGRTIQLHVDTPSPALREVHAAHGARSSAFLTAWNPGSQPLDDRENARRNRALRGDAALLGHPAIAGEGLAPDGSWVEESFLVLGIPEAVARELARRYGQNAFLFAGEDGVPRLLFTSE